MGEFNNRRCLSECAKRALKPHQEGVKGGKKLTWQKSRHTIEEKLLEDKDWAIAIAMITEM